MKIKPLLHLLTLGVALLSSLDSAHTAQTLSLLCATNKTVTCDLGASSPAYSVVRSFYTNGIDGESPRGGLLQGSDGALYGTTPDGGTNGFGTVFKMNKNGSGYTVLRNYNNTDANGRNPAAGLIEGTDGWLYGTTQFRGATGPGAVFKMQKDGTGYTRLHSFTNGNGGEQPRSGLVEGTDGALYGTTSAGGTNDVGTIFTLNKDGTGYTVLRSFSTNAADGQSPWAGLVEGTDGWLYGTTRSGGSNDVGTVFKLNKDGSGYARLHSFTITGNDGQRPYASLVEGTDGWLYGTTHDGGSSANGTVFKLNKDGSGYTRLRSFSNTGGDGQNPFSGLIEGTDGWLYGTTYLGGSNGVGSVFTLNKDGTGYSVLSSFSTNAGDARRPFAGVIQGSDGALHGITEAGGSNNVGTVFQLQMPCAWNFDPPTVMNACCGGNGVTITVLSTVTNGGSCVQLITRTWQATDCCTNTAMCSQTVTVVGGSPLVILAQPASVTATACSDAMFAVRASGSGPISYGWFANGQPILNANDAAYTKSPVALADNGTVFTVHITNECGSVTSTQAVLTVFADMAPPILVSVSATCGSNNVTLAFSERLDAVGATNPSNYQISGGVTVQRAVLGTDARTVQVTTTPRSPGTNYTVLVNGVLDLCGNVVAANSQILFSCSPPPLITVFINEWLAANVNDIVDPADGQHDEWFELYNPGPAPADLTGYFLSDSLTNRFKFQIPAGYMVPPGGFLLVWADNQVQENTNTPPDLHVNFTLPGGGEIGLFAGDGTPIDTITFGVQTNDVSEGRWPDGGPNRSFMVPTTPRGANVTPQGSVPCSSKGTSFWLAFPYSTGDAYLDEMKVFISGCAGASGTVTVGKPGQPSSSHSFTIPALGGMTAVALLPSPEIRTSDVIGSLGVHVTATAPVSVYGFMGHNASSGGYLALPESALGKDYLVLAHGGSGGSLPGQYFVVVASMDNTTVTIKPNVTVGPHVAGVPYTKVLDAGQSYQLLSFDDFTSSSVRADKPIAVFSGTACAYIRHDPCDKLIEQMQPTTTWCKEFFTMRLAPRGKGDTFRILASANNTHIQINDGGMSSFVYLANRGDFHERLIKGPAHITANQPLMVAQYANSSGFDGVFASDPFMMLVAAPKQYVKDYCLTTSFLTVAFYYNWLNLIVPTAAVGFIRIDNDPPLAANLFTQIDSSGFWGARVQVSAGKHSLTGPSPFGVQVYGWSGYEGYGYPADMCLEPQPANQPPVVTCPGNLNFCNSNSGAMILIPAQVSDADGDGLDVEWRVNGILELGFSTPVGTTVLVQNLGFYHNFAPGTHTVTLTVSDGNGPPVTCTTIVTVGDVQPPIPCTASIAGPMYSTWPSGLTLTGYPSAPVSSGGILKLTTTTAINPQLGGTAVLPQFNDATLIHAFRATFQLYMGGSTWPFPPYNADGFSFNLADDVPAVVSVVQAHEGIGTGLTVEFDSFDNGPGDPTGIFLKSGGPSTQPIDGTAFQPSQGPLVTAPGWLDVEITMDSCGYVKVIYNGQQRAAGQISYVPGPNARFALGAATGQLNDNHWVQNLAITTETGAPDITVTAPANECCVPVSYTPCFTDTCDPNLTIVCVPPSGSCFPIGVNRVCCTATDAVGNQSRYGFNVIVKDTTPLVMHCAPDKTVECGSPWSFDAPTATALCGVSVTIISTTVLSGPCPQVIERTWQATDRSGNTATCSQKVTVADTTLPVFTTNCVTNHYEAGTVSDGFEGAEPTSPSAGLLMRLATAGVLSKGFDDCTENRFVAHTFANLPQCITAATLTVRLKPCGFECNNDSFGFYFTDASGISLPGGWSRVLGSGAGSPPDLLPNNWCDYTGGRTFTFDLAALPQAGGSLLSFLNQYGFLDIICQDDTAVDYLTLDVVSCCFPINKTVECGSVWSFDVPAASDACCPNVTISDLGTVTLGTGCSQISTKTWQAIDCCGNIASWSQTVVVGTSPCWPPSTVSIARVGANFEVTWTGPGHLEATDNLFVPVFWFPVSTSSPYTTSAAPGGFAFFRVVCP